MLPWEAFRVSELMAHSKSDHSRKFFQVGDLEWVVSGVRIRFKQTKPDQLARGQELVLQRVAEDYSPYVALQFARPCGGTFSASDWCSVDQVSV